MSEDQEKTEEPTQKKLDDAKKKGQVAFSREVSNFFMILALTLSIVMLFPGILISGQESLGKYIGESHRLQVESDTMPQIMEMIITDAFSLILMPFLLFVVAAITASFIQNGFNISLESIKPKLEKISINKGIKRLFSSRSMMEFIKGVLKISVVGIIAFFAVYYEINQLKLVSQLEAPQLFEFMETLSMRILIGCLIAVFLIAIADFIYQKTQHIKQLKMSMQEIKDEYKQQEGDPKIKGKLKQIRMERARKRMIAAVPDADVVITNPTHYAVALKYDQNEMDAPMVIAMGADNIALKIKEVAEENNIAIVRNAPLARVLYAEGDIDAEIPLEHYQAVAEVISYVFKTKKK